MEKDEESQNKVVSMKNKLKEKLEQFEKEEGEKITKKENLHLMEIEITH